MDLSVSCNQGQRIYWPIIRLTRCLENLHETTRARILGLRVSGKSDSAGVTVCILTLEFDVPQATVLLSYVSMF